MGETPIPPSSGRSWVGIVANQNSGIGRGRQRVAKLSLALSQAGLCPQVAWTTEDRTKLVQAPSTTRIAGAWSPSAVTARSQPCLTNVPRFPCRCSPRGRKTLLPSNSACDATQGRSPRLISQGQPRRVDVGLAGGRPIPVDGRFRLRWRRRIPPSSRAVALGTDPTDQPLCLRPSRAAIQFFL